MDAQQFVALGIVASAAASISVRLIKHARGTGGGSCPGCGECGREPSPKLRPAPVAKPLITLSAGMPSRRQAVALRDPQTDNKS